MIDVVVFSGNLIYADEVEDTVSTPEGAVVLRTDTVAAEPEKLTEFCGAVARRALAIRDTGENIPVHGRVILARNVFGQGLHLPSFEYGPIEPGEIVVLLNPDLPMPPRFIMGVLEAILGGKKWDRWLLELLNMVMDAAAAGTLAREDPEIPAR